MVESEVLGSSPFWVNKRTGLRSDISERLQNIIALYSQNYVQVAHQYTL